MALRRLTDTQPQYTGLLTFNWDLFTGFKRLNDVRQAEADRDAASDQLKSLEVDTISSVWRAYYEFQTALSRYTYAKALLAASQESYDANLDTYRAGTQHDRRIADRRSRPRQRAVHDCSEPRRFADVVSRRRVRRGSHRDAAASVMP